jgi:capsular polysaccharide biosynthesis protein
MRMESLMVKAIRQLIRQAVCSTRSPQWLASPAYAERFHAPWHQIYGTMPNRRSPAVQYGPSQVDLQSRLDPEFPATGVLLLQGARLYGQSGWLFSKEGYLLPDHSWYGRHVDEMTEIPRFLPHGDAIAGVGLSLVSDFAVKNYGHFLLDCLGRLALFEQAGFTLADVDYLFCPKPPSKTAQRLFEQLGLAGCTCIWADDNRGRILRTETLIAPTFPGTRRNYPRWLPRFLQQKLLPSPPTPSRRLYISRAGCRRNVANEAEIVAILKKYDFEIYDPSRQDNQPHDFAEAAIIVGPHGSGLADLVFCQRGTTVLELLPSDHLYPYYYTLSDAAGLAYGYLLGDSTRQRRLGAWGPSKYDFSINAAEFESALAQIIRAS